MKLKKVPQNTIKLGKYTDGNVCARVWSLKTGGHFLRGEPTPGLEVLQNQADTRRAKPDPTPSLWCQKMLKFKLQSSRYKEIWRT